MSPSTSCSRNHRAPHCHGRCRSLTRNDATIIRTRLCMKPVSASWRMPASTIGKPVRPAFHASNASLGLAVVVDLDRVEVACSSSTTRCRAIRRAPRRRSRGRPAPAGTPARPCLGRGRRPWCADGWCRTSGAPTSGWWRRGRAGCGRRRSRRARCSTNVFHCLRAAVSPAGSSSSTPGVGDVARRPARRPGRSSAPTSAPDFAGRRQPCLRHAS